MSIARWLVVVACSTGGIAACVSGGGDGSGTSASGDGGGGTRPGASDDDATCSMKTTLSGGVTASVGDSSQACGYSQRSVAFAPLDGKVVVTMIVEDVEREQTGTFPARLDVRANDETWSGAQCTVDIESNVVREKAGDGGSMFDQYLLKGKGSCTTPAVQRGDAGTKEPVTIAPFTFVFTTLFY